MLVFTLPFPWTLLMLSLLLKTYFYCALSQSSLKVQIILKCPGLSWWKRKLDAKIAAYLKFLYVLQGMCTLVTVIYPFLGSYFIGLSAFRIASSGISINLFNVREHGPHFLWDRASHFTSLSESSLVWSIKLLLLSLTVLIFQLVSSPLFLRRSWWHSLLIRLKRFGRRWKISGCSL